MVRELDIGWNHATPVGGNKQHSKCNYCDKVIKGGGISRFKRHLAGVTGEVEICLKCPDGVREVMLENLKSGKEKMSQKQAKDDGVKELMMEEYIPETQKASGSVPSGIGPSGIERLMDVEDNMKGDKLILRGLKFHGYHGVKPEERKLGQKFLIDVDAWMDLREAGISDCLSDSVSYTAIYSIVRDVMEGPPLNLLETASHRIATMTLTQFPQISSVRVKVGKPHVAVHGTVDYLGVEIVRHRRIDV